MVALDNSALFGDGHGLARFRVTLAPLVGAIALVAAMLVLGSILARGFAENGFRLGSQLAWRYASLVFFAALVALLRTADAAAATGVTSVASTSITPLKSSMAVLATCAVS